MWKNTTLSRWWALLRLATVLFAVSFGVGAAAQGPGGPGIAGAEQPKTFQEAFDRLLPSGRTHVLPPRAVPGPAVLADVLATPDAVPFLLSKLAKDQPWVHRVAAARALGSIPKLEEDRPVNRRAAAAGVFGIDPEKGPQPDFPRYASAGIIAALFGVLKEPYELPEGQDRKQIRATVASWQKQAEVQRQAAFSLGMLKQQSTVEGLLRILADRPQERSEKAERAGTPESYRQVFRAGVRGAVATALGHIGDPRAVPALLETLNNDPYFQRGRRDWFSGRTWKPLIRTLGHLGGPQAIAALMAELPKDRLVVMQALAETADPSLAGFFREAFLSKARGWSSAGAGLRKIGTPEAVAALAEGLYSPDREVLDRAICLLGWFAQERGKPLPAEVVKRLEELRDTNAPLPNDPSARQAAIDAMRKSRLRAPPHAIRLHAMQALDRHRGAVRKQQGRPGN